MRALGLVCLLATAAWAHASAAADDDDDASSDEEWSDALSTSPADAFARVLACLSVDGRMDGLWLHLSGLDPSTLVLPPLSPSLPATLIDFLERLTLKNAQVSAPSAFVDAVRQAYPPRLRLLFPHNRFVAQQLLDCYPDKAALAQPHVVDELAVYGITFGAQEFARRVLRQRKLSAADAAGRWRGLRRHNPPGPSGLVAVIAEDGREADLDALFEIAQYKWELDHRSAGGGVIPTVSAALPALTPGGLGRLLAQPWIRNRVNRGAVDAYGRNLMHAACAADRVLDLGAVVLSATLTDPSALCTDGTSIVDHLPEERPAAVLDLLRLRRTAPGLDYALRRPLANALAEAVFRACQRQRGLLRTLLQDPDQADLIGVIVVDGAVFDFGRTFMHACVERRAFALVADLLLYAPDAARFAVPDQTGRSAIGLLTLDALPAFLRHLPQPQASWLSRFHLPDLVPIVTNQARMRLAVTLGTEAVRSALHTEAAAVPDSPEVDALAAQLQRTHLKRKFPWPSRFLRWAVRSTTGSAAPVACFTLGEAQPVALRRPQRRARSARRRAAVAPGPASPVTPVEPRSEPAEDQYDDGVFVFGRHSQ